MSQNSRLHRARNWQRRWLDPGKEWSPRCFLSSLSDPLVDVSSILARTFGFNLTVGIARSGMEPAPVSVEDDGVLLGGARTASGTFGHAELWMDLGGVGASLLGIDARAERECCDSE